MAGLFVHDRATTAESMVKTMLAHVQFICARERKYSNQLANPTRQGAGSNPPMSEPVIRVEDLHKSYDDGRSAARRQLRSKCRRSLRPARSERRRQNFDDRNSGRTARTRSRKSNRRRTRSANRRPRIQARSRRSPAIDRAARKTARRRSAIALCQLLSPPSRYRSAAEAIPTGRKAQRVSTANSPAGKSSVWHWRSRW